MSQGEPTTVNPSGASPARRAPLPGGTPESQGIPSAAILAMLRRWEASDCEPHSVVIVRHGHVVTQGWWAPYRPEHRQLLYSVSKTFLALAVALAEDEGLLGRSERLVDIFPEAAASAGPRASMITVEHCLRMSTGHHEDTLDSVAGLLGSADGAAALFLAAEPQHEPGSWFVYHNGASLMLALAVQRRTGQRLLRYLRPRLLEPLGIPSASWRNTAGRDLGFSGLHTTTDAVARLGVLLLDDGMWQGSRLLPSGWVGTASSALSDTGHHPGTPDWQHGYGYQMWRSRHDGFRADGAYGQFSLIHPRHDLVVAITACTDDAQPLLDAVWEELIPALTEAPCTAAPEAVNELARALDAAALPAPVSACEPSGPGPWVFTHEPTPEHPRLTGVEVRPHGDGWLLLVVDGEPLTITCGDGRWPDAAGVPFVAAGGWVSTGVFEATVIAVQTPHSLHLRCADGVVSARWRGYPLHGPCLAWQRDPDGD